MTGTWVIYYPPTTNYPYLVVTFLPDRGLQATPFDSEEEASAFIDPGSPHRRSCPSRHHEVAGRFASRGLRFGRQTIGTRCA